MPIGYWDGDKWWKQLTCHWRYQKWSVFFLAFRKKCAFLWFVVDTDTTYAITLESVLAGHENWVYAVHWQPSFSKGKLIPSTLAVMLSVVYTKYGHICLLCCTCHRGLQKSLHFVTDVLQVNMCFGWMCPNSNLMAQALSVA